jgi:two-component system LytT family sensor kinase
MSAHSRLLVLALAWLALSLITTSQGVLTYLATGGQVNVGVTLLVNLALWLPWAILTPMILGAARRWPLTAAGGRIRRLALHVALNLTLAMVAALIYRGLRVALGLPVRANYGVLVASGLNTALIIYWGLVGLEHGITYYRQSRDRERLAAEMRRQLSEARLDALRAQIHPHFLFNTLHAIASRVRHDARGAEDMLGALGEMLRANLATSGAQETTLRDELALIERYLAIQVVRFGDRMKVDLDIDPATLGLAVPALILQPLVENAIEHGIARRLSGGTLRVDANLAGPQLRLIVTDSGGAHARPAASESRWNVGLTNTRERLQALYGDDQTLQVASERDGAFKVCVSIPARQLAGSAA